MAVDAKLVQDFADNLKSKLSLPGGGSQKEDQLKPLVAKLLAEFGKSIGVKVETLTESSIREHRVRPDIAVYINGLICGYVELKAPGKGADATKLKGHDATQWQKLKALPNIIYTDGTEWALYRTGEKPANLPLLRLTGDLAAKGGKAITASDANALYRILKPFLQWTPIIPGEAKKIAEYLAPLTRFLRSEVENALVRKNSAINQLAKEWRQYFFPDASDAQFADAYAQTTTYAMLLARLSGAETLDPATAVKALGQKNNLLAEALNALSHKDAQKELQTGFELLKRAMEALNKKTFANGKVDMWLYFYEDFLAAYDPKLRKNYGVYYTPREVVELQIRLTSELLDTHFGKKLGFADDDVSFIDPAVGTGTYLISAVNAGLEKVAAHSGKGAVASRARHMADTMRGFEILIGPYAVAHLRLTQTLENAMNGEDKLGTRLKIYLADTLESPNKETPKLMHYKSLTEEHNAARKVKMQGNILVCIGNPPYDRETRENKETANKKGGWVRYGDDTDDAVILDDFVKPALAAKVGANLKSIYNVYVYFWRWALWRLFEKQNCGGIISFITPSSYLAGDGFAGMRETMRKRFDELWIIDLGGDSRTPRPSPNVFDIQTPVAIAIGVRGENNNGATHARVNYCRIDADTREEKLEQLDAIQSFTDIDWQDCPSALQAPFLPSLSDAQKATGYYTWPKLDNLLPLHMTGALFHRSWPVGETKKVLEKRWNELRKSEKDDRAKLFVETVGRLTIHYRVNRDKTYPGYHEPSIADITKNAKEPLCLDFGFRPFDRHYCYYDFRLGNELRPDIYKILSDKQLFLISLRNNVMGRGLAMHATDALPYRHAFCGKWGGSDVYPLYRDKDGKEANVTRGLLAKLQECYGFEIQAKQFIAYIYGLLANQYFIEKFSGDIIEPGIRVPITKDGELFTKIAEIGQALLDASRYKNAPQGKARVVSSVPQKPYPKQFAYDEINAEIIVGDGKFAPVPKSVWEYSVSGYEIVSGWLAYRMPKRPGKTSSPLDKIRPEAWTPAMSDDFLRLLWLVEFMLAKEAELSKLLDAISNGECFNADDLPSPSKGEREIVVPDLI